MKKVPSLVENIKNTQTLTKTTHLKESSIQLPPANPDSLFIALDKQRASAMRGGKKSLIIHKIQTHSYTDAHKARATGGIRNGAMEEVE